MALADFLQNLPAGLSPAQISRKAMGFLVRKQYVGKRPPDCDSVRDLIVS